MPYLLGIDLGATTVTAAALRGATGEPMRPGGISLPALLVATPAGDLLCGAAAARRAPAEPDRVARGFLDRVGDPTPLSLGGLPHLAEDLCARLVRVVVDEMTARYGGPPSRIGVTHPVAWGRHKRDLLAAAIGRRGLTVSLVTAPQAVALARRTDAPAEGPLVVVDVGGNGSTATTLAPAAPGVLPGIVGSPLTCAAGGADVDDAVFAFVRSATPRLAAAFDALDVEDPQVLATLAALRDDCRAAKELLSRDTVAGVTVDLPGVSTTVRIHRSDLDELAAPVLEPVADLLAEVVESVPDAEVLLAGGAARTPVVVQLLSARSGRPVAVTADPVHDTARGAALAVAPGAGTSWPGTRIAPVPAPGDGTGPRPAVSASHGTAPRVVVPAQRGGASRAQRSERVRPERIGSAIGLLDPATGPLPVQRGAAASSPALPVTRSAGLPPVPQSDPGALPGVPDSVISRDLARPSVARGLTRQRVLLGAGCLAGTLAVTGALLFWPSSAPALGELSAAPTSPSTSAPPASQLPPPDAAVAVPGAAAPVGADATVAARAGAGAAGAPAAPTAAPATGAGAAAPARGAGAAAPTSPRVVAPPPAPVAVPPPPAASVPPPTEPPPAPEPSTPPPPPTPSSEAEPSSPVPPPTEPVPPPPPTSAPPAA
ncbi:Hsp70 family protein [Pseudonocardia sp. NPDC049635]|uniref:Hsp70 family protein n=1 Tax=Pseudonocardia sp. NPDC049635 TaxID=3155506 RepID=UPI0033D722A6